MLTEERMVAFLQTADAGRTRAFYEGKLGLTFVEDGGHLLVMNGGAAQVSFVKSSAPIPPPPGTALGWNVADLRASMKALIARGVAFDRGPNMLPDDDLPIWSAYPGFGVAWFFDPDQNRLSLSGPI